MTHNKLKLTLIAALLLVPLALAAVACGDETTRIESTGDRRTGITVAGEGKVTAPPDVAVITLGVSTLAPSVGEARDRAAASLDAIVATLRDNGIDEDDIQTQQFSINAEYDFRDGSQTLRGFRVTNTLSAKLRDIDRTGEVVDDAVTAGGDDTQVQNIAFTIDDPVELRDEARRKAVEDARARAETLADASGVSVGDPIAIDESSVTVPPIYYERGIAADAAQPAPETPIQPGELDVVVTVSVTFAIE